MPTPGLSVHPLQLAVRGDATHSPRRAIATQVSYPTVKTWAIPIRTCGAPVCSSGKKQTAP
jgi:hypothetical protein